jgi:hypothetical protein
MLISNFSSNKQLDPQADLRDGRYDMEVYTGFDRMAREEDQEDAASLSGTKEQEYRVCDYLDDLGVRVVDFKSYIEDMSWVSQSESVREISLNEVPTSDRAGEGTFSECVGNLSSPQRWAKKLNTKKVGSLNLRISVVEAPNQARNSQNSEDECSNFTTFRKVSLNSNNKSGQRPPALDVVRERSSHGASSKEQTPETVGIKMIPARLMASDL